MEVLVRKPIVWAGKSRSELSTFPRPVRLKIGFALYEAQLGGRHHDARPLRGFGGGAVLEVVVSQAGNAYRGVYTVRFPGAIYVLHIFQKKSKHGIVTPKKELDLVKKRLHRAESDYENRSEGKDKE